MHFFLLLFYLGREGGIAFFQTGGRRQQNNLRKLPASWLETFGLKKMFARGRCWHDFRVVVHRDLEVVCPEI